MSSYKSLAPLCTAKIIMGSAEEYNPQSTIRGENYPDQDIRIFYS
jgi:hypothetical protein